MSPAQSLLGGHCHRRPGGADLGSQLRGCIGPGREGSATGTAGYDSRANVFGSAAAEGVDTGTRRVDSWAEDLPSERSPSCVKVSDHRNANGVPIPHKPRPNLLTRIDRVTGSELVVEQVAIGQMLLLKTVVWRPWVARARHTANSPAAKQGPHLRIRETHNAWGSCAHRLRVRWQSECGQGSTDERQEFREFHELSLWVWLGRNLVRRTLLLRYVLVCSLRSHKKPYADRKANRP
jgi:hypothetical protein